ncbi:DUF924 domain-containing protein [Alcaligenaceae bacterium]|nr:DUF924 domain-containing protein [Alcaligenaceae bacterium]
MAASVQNILDFWRDAGEAYWFNADHTFDALCSKKFLDLHLAAARGELMHWSQTAESALALLLLLDQLPRNIFRHSAHAYATDPMACSLADYALSQAYDQQFPPDLRSFFYLPFMHSEQLVYQERASVLFQTVDTPRAIKWRTHHLSIIQRFGRFPHRNHLLGRTNTPEEQRWLADGGFKG